MFLLYFWRASLYHRWRLPDERCRDIATTTTWTKGGEGNKDVVGGTKGDGIQWKNCNKCILGHGKRSLNVESRLVSFRTLSLRETFLMKITRKSVNILNFFHDHHQNHHHHHRRHRPATPATIPIFVLAINKRVSRQECCLLF